MKKTRYPGISRLGEGRYRIRVQLRKKNGRPRREADRIVECRDIRAAMAERARLYAQLALGGSPIEGITVRAFASLWLESKALRIARSTAERYATALELHVMPELGDYAVAALTRQDIESWVVAKAKQFAPETVNGWLRVLKLILGDATEEYQLPDPSARVSALPVSHPDDDPNALTEGELCALLHAFEVSEPGHYPLILTIALTGLRWGEATALKWDDLDREAGIIRVRRAHYRGTMKATKTNRPRTAPLPPVLIEVLDSWRAQLVRKQRPGLEAGWCFPSRKGTPRLGSSITKPLRRCLKAAGIGKRVTVQGLRRSAEDLLRRLNVAGPVAEALMGHNARMRSRYSTVADHEVASIGPRIVQAIGLSREFVGDRVGDQPLEKENASLPSKANEASSRSKIRAGDEI